MVSFYVYDIIFLVVFTLGVFLFLYRGNQKNLKREGWMFMYRTQLGVDAMSWFDKKFHNILGGLRYVIVTVGFFLMAAMIFLLGQTVWLYITKPEISQQIKAPPIAPLIPYFPELFGLKSLFPPFYFTYFLVALAIVAFVHEFSHGIFMRYSKTKIKSTGLVFLGPILGAFVEEDQKNFYAKDRFNQMSVLGAGVFANLIFAILFYLLYVGFFYLSFSAGGFVFDSYALGVVNSTNIDATYESGNYTVLIVGDNNYYLDDSLKFQLESNSPVLLAYYDSPAFQSKIYGVITGIDDNPIKSEEDLSHVLEKYKPGDSAKIYTLANSETHSFDVVFDEHPDIEGRAYLGVGYYGNQPNGIVSRFLASLVSFRTGSTYYQTNYDSGLVYFIYYLLWWVMVINLLVALFNMLPLGILDGGRFFYLAVDKFFGSKIAQKTYIWASRIIFASFILLLLIWIIRFF